MSVLKWCLNRPKQAEDMRGLADLCGISVQVTKYKPLCDRQIQSSEKYVQRIMGILNGRFLNPFGAEVDKDESVYSLSSGMPFQGNTGLLEIKKNEEKLYNNFKKHRLHSTEIAFHAKILKQKPTLLSDTRSKAKRKKDNTFEVIKANRNILSKLLTLSANAQQPIEFEKVLSYPLFHVPLSLAFPDGTKRSNQKSKLLEIIMKTRKTDKHEKDNHANTKKDVSILIVDMIAHYRVISQNLPDTFEDWIKRIKRFLQTLHNEDKYNRIGIVADTYRNFSINSGEREKRGSSSKILIKSVDGKIPRDVGNFFSNNENKIRLIDLTFDYIKRNPVQCLALLICNVVVLSGDNYCDIVFSSQCQPCDELVSDQEEADTKVVLDATRFLSENKKESVCIRSPSGDTDILVIALATITERSRVVFDNGNSRDRKQICLNELKLPVDLRHALIGFHALTGNDCVIIFSER